MGLFTALGIVSLVSGFFQQKSAAKRQRREVAAQQSRAWEQSKKMDALATKQKTEKDKISRRISLSKVRSARRRVRGGLFGGGSQDQIDQTGTSSRLGG